MITVKDENKKKVIWRNKEAEQLSKAKNQAFRKYYKTGEGGDEYYEIRNNSNTANRSAEKSFEKLVASELKTKPKNFHALVNSRLKVKSSISELTTPDQTATTDTEKAEMLNKYFGSVFTKEDWSNMPEYDRHEKAAPEVIIDVEDVAKRLRSLDVNKSPGPDQIHPRILKELADVIAPVVAALYKKSIEAGDMPQLWKTAHVTPIFKKGSKKLPENYRPVSLTAILCKILEQIIAELIIKHMEDENLLSDQQYGFRKNRSCSSQLMAVIEEWTDLIEDKCPIDTIYFDFAKAFDKVPHGRLVNKLEAYGIRGNTLRWIKNYLDNRKQSVVVNGEVSSTIDVTSGVPQGSVLGPTLFILFINDLPTVVNNEVRLFADDTKLYGKADSKESCQNLQKDIDALEEWASESLMKFHPKKCKVLRIGTGHAEYEYTMKGDDYPRTAAKLEFVDSEKDLGIITDKKLSFEDHINTKIASADRVVGMIMRSFRYMTKDMFNHLYKSMVRPIIEYGNVIWQPTVDEIGLTKKIEKVQRRATKRVPGLRHMPYAQRLRVLRLPSLLYRRRRGNMIEVWKRLHNKYDDKYPWLKLDPNQGLRYHSLKLYKRQVDHRLKKKAFSFRTVKDWNSLTEEVVTAKTVNSFKNRLDHLWSNIQYDHLED